MSNSSRVGRSNNSKVISDFWVLGKKNIYVCSWVIYVKFTEMGKRSSLVYFWVSGLEGYVKMWGYGNSFYVWFFYFYCFGVFIENFRYRE